MCNLARLSIIQDYPLRPQRHANFGAVAGGLSRPGRARAPILRAFRHMYSATPLPPSNARRHLRHLCHLRPPSDIFDTFAIFERPGPFGDAVKDFRGEFPRSGIRLVIRVDGRVGLLPNRERSSNHTDTNDLCLR